MGFYDDEIEEEVVEQYILRVQKGWFRGKDVFTDRLWTYEQRVVDEDYVKLPINAGNMIYVMMRRLEIGVDWAKQDALIHSYRDLMYKLSYVNVMWYKQDMANLHIEGEKDDVMWALSFITQVFPDVPMECETASEETPISFSVQNGEYAGFGATEAKRKNKAIPDIWALDDISTEASTVAGEIVSYNPEFEPTSGSYFAIPDGRVAQYIPMDDRFTIAEQTGSSVDLVTKHNISASLIKDFSDLVHKQTTMEYDLYRMRYVAFMNKVHELEKQLGGLEASCYDILPIGERGLPYASAATLDRTNQMDQNSLKYCIDKIERNKNHLSERERKKMMSEIGLDVLYRIDGYDIEFQTYQLTGSDINLCSNIRLKYCYELYADFAIIESYKMMKFPQTVYRALCNAPENPGYRITDFERQRLQLFGRGYYDFVAYQAEHVTNKRLKITYETAWRILNLVYKG